MDLNTSYVSAVQIGEGVGKAISEGNLCYLLILFGSSGSLSSYGAIILTQEPKCKVSDIQFLFLLI